MDRREFIATAGLVAVGATIGRSADEQPVAVKPEVAVPLNRGLLVFDRQLNGAEQQAVYEQLRNHVRQGSLTWIDPSDVVIAGGRLVELKDQSGFITPGVALTGSLARA